MNEDTLARETCASFLAAAQLKDICKESRLCGSSGRKDDAAAFVAARFNGSEGVAEAMRSLDETWLFDKPYVTSRIRLPEPGSQPLVSRGIQQGFLGVCENFAHSRHEAVRCVCLLEHRAGGAT